MLQGTASGIGSELSGGKFGDGLGRGIGMYSVGEASSYMRYRMIVDSMRNPDNFSGDSVGWRGDGAKVGGGRVDSVTGVAGISPLGGPQGGPGYFGFGWNGQPLTIGGYELGIRYGSGSMFDYVTEAYSGPHDYLNSWTYDANGNYGITGHMDTVSSIGNALNVAVATPFVAGATIQAYAPSWAIRRRW